MKKTTITYIVSDTNKTKQQILHWCNQFNICCFFDNNNYHNQYNSFNCLAGVNNNSKTIESNTIVELQQILIQKNNWYFGHISYDFKNQLFPLTSNHQDGINFPEIFLFEPEIIVKLSDNRLFIESATLPCDIIFKEITSIELSSDVTQTHLNIQPKISREEYINIINKLKHHIQMGDCYEINFCHEFFAENATINPLHIYKKLNTISPTPFSAYYKLNDKFLLCASPERFIKKVGNTIISQPIKGTAKRNLTNAIEDEKLKNDLQHSQKEKSENVMIVDLVRNDLSKICTAGTVAVDELMKIYSFKQVHQMITTVVGALKSETSFYDVLQALFPMGSMTGAPKLKVMQLIELYERSKRNIYSGTIGYIAPNGDFDFNVVIRSIAYNATNKYVSYQVGSAITHYSHPEQEYEECILKASAIEKVLKSV